ncbi:lysine--tRNA ligase [candidate division WWE3 bacterium]|nr:lysine--tRNA ligase [candidate division WWE3 bacterium]
MATLSELRRVRIQKLDELRRLGINPYPAKSNRNIQNAELVAGFESLEGRAVSVAGRVLALRRHGSVLFIDVKDATGKIQLYIKEQNLQGVDHRHSELSFGEIGLVDLGDFVEGMGKVVKTKAGEVSVEVEKLRILTKSLRPLPGKWDGLKDKETRLRRRYLDTNVNQNVYDRFIRRSKFWEAHREFFKEHGFLEMNVPVLEYTPGGADANPFVTHMDAIDQDFYLRISQELYLKRLVGGGYEKVYEIGPRFRNEGLSDEHLPEHIAMEFYWAYADWEEGMKFVKDLFSYVIDEVYQDKRKFNIKGFEVDFSKDWEVIDFAKIMKDKFDIDVYGASLDEVRDVLSRNRRQVADVVNVGRGIDALWKILRKEIGGPAFLINHPKSISPLSKCKVEDPLVTERFQPIVGGSELGNGWSELNDPLDQLERFRQQEALREAGDAEAQRLDVDYVEMLEYGMPPTFGYGHSERVFWYLEDVSAREGVVFPQLKFELDEATREIYGL